MIGGVRIGAGITINQNGVISVASGGSSVTVVNVLTSTSATDALSAAQGKVLKGLIDAIPPPPTWSTLAGKPAIPTVVNALTSTSTTHALSAAQGKILDDKITALGSGGSSIIVEDSLSSRSRTNALSAEKGRVLNDMIGAIKAVKSPDNSVLNIVKMTQGAYNALANQGCHHPLCNPMTLNFGSAAVTGLKIGAAGVARLMAGTNQIWPSLPFGSLRPATFTPHTPKAGDTIRYTQLLSIDASSTPHTGDYIPYTITGVGSSDISIARNGFALLELASANNWALKLDLPTTASAAGKTITISWGGFTGTSSIRVT